MTGSPKVEGSALGSDGHHVSAHVMPALWPGHSQQKLSDRRSESNCEMLKHGRDGGLQAVFAPLPPQEEAAACAPPSVLGVASSKQQQRSGGSYASPRRNGAGGATCQQHAAAVVLVASAAAAAGAL